MPTRFLGSVPFPVTEDFEQPDTAPGDSAEQRKCELVMLTLVSQAVGRPLAKTRITLTNGCFVEVDGCSDDRTLLCEAWAHQGKPKSAQKAKVLTDAAKLFVAGQTVRAERKII